MENIKNSVELCNFIEKLRYGRKLTQEEFVFDVVSLRQYKRYRSGESKLPISNLIKFSKKLDVSLVNLLLEFDKEKKVETDLMNSLYNSIINYNLVKANEILSNTNIDYILDKDNRLYYRYSLYLYKHQLNSITTQVFFEKICEIIDFPRILKKVVLSDIEVLILSSLLEFESNVDRNLILEKLINCISENSYILSGNNERIELLIYIRVAKYLGIIGDFDEVISMCLKGIKKCSQISSIYLLDYFYYYLALSHYKKGENEQFIHYIYQCFNAIYLEEDESKINKFEKLIVNDFNINYSDFISLYANEIKNYFNF